MTHNRTHCYFHLDFHALFYTSWTLNATQTWPTPHSAVPGWYRIIWPQIYFAVSKKERCADDSQSFSASIWQASVSIWAFLWHGTADEALLLRLREIPSCNQVSFATLFLPVAMQWLTSLWVSFTGNEIWILLIEVCGFSIAGHCLSKSLSVLSNKIEFHPFCIDRNRQIYVTI